MGLAPPSTGFDAGASGHGTGGMLPRLQEKSTPTFLPGPSHPTPAVRMGSATVNGRLPKEVVQRIVHQHLGGLRICYESGLRQQPTLSGRVTTRFVIGGDGSVSTAQDAGSDLPDPAAVQCVVRELAGMEFPKPEGGVVVVTLPLFFTASQP